MKITREVLILREVLSLLESLKPAQREWCIEEILHKYHRAWAKAGSTVVVPGIPKSQETAVSGTDGQILAWRDSSKEEADHGA